MHSDDFKIWLSEVKGMQHRSIKDIESRLKRVNSLLESDSITRDSVYQLEKNEAFNLLTVTVKSQLRRAIKLYCEYYEGNLDEK